MRHQIPSGFVTRVRVIIPLVYTHDQKTRDFEKKQKIVRAKKLPHEQSSGFELSLNIMPQTHTWRIRRYGYTLLTMNRHLR